VACGWQYAIHMVVDPSPTRAVVGFSVRRQEACGRRQAARHVAWRVAGMQLLKVKGCAAGSIKARCRAGRQEVVYAKACSQQLRAAV